MHVCIKEWGIELIDRASYKSCVYVHVCKKVQNKSYKTPTRCTKVHYSCRSEGQGPFDALVEHFYVSVKSPSAL